MIIYAAQYNPLIYESCARTLSLHMTKSGALNAIEKDIIRAKEEYEELTIGDDTFPSWDEAKEDRIWYVAEFVVYSK